MKNHVFRRYLTIGLSFLSLTFIAGLCTGDNSTTPAPGKTTTPGCGLKTDDKSVTYAGIYSGEVKQLLNNSTPWKTPSCDGGTDFQFPRSFSGLCLRDQYVEAAIKIAFTVEYKWRTGKKSEAEDFARTVRQTLNSADGLCSTNTSICSDCDCSTKDVWPCPNKTTTTTQTTAGFTFSPTQNLIAPQKITFTNTSKNATTSTWNFGDGSTSTEVSPTKTFTTANTYTVKLTVSGSGGTSTAQEVIQVNAVTSAGSSGEIPGRVYWSNIPANVHQALTAMKTSGRGNAIRLIDVAPDNSYAIIEGDNGYNTAGIPTSIFEAIKTANANSRIVKDIAITRNAGVLLWGYNGYNTAGLTTATINKFKEYADGANYELNGFTLGADNATWSIFFGNGGSWVFGSQAYIDDLTSASYKVSRSEMTLDNSGWVLMNKEGTQLTWRGIPADCSATLKTLLETNRKKILDIAFTPGEGYIIVYQ